MRPNLNRYISIFGTHKGMPWGLPIGGLALKYDHTGISKRIGASTDHLIGQQLTPFLGIENSDRRLLIIKKWHG